MYKTAFRVAQTITLLTTKKKKKKSFIVEIKQIKHLHNSFLFYTQVWVGSTGLGLVGEKKTVVFSLCTILFENAIKRVSRHLIVRTCAGHMSNYLIR